ncbi:MAG: hypothetical protein QM660_08805 [Dysgonomonas sp.]
MPIYKSNGKTYNIPDDKVNDFLSSKKDAKLVDNTPYHLSRATSTPRQSNIQKQTDTQVEESPVQQPDNGITGGFTTYKDGTSGFIPAMKMPDIKIEQPKIDISSTGTDKSTGLLQPFGKGKPLTESIGDVMKSMPVRPEAHFDMAQSTYKQNQEWIKEVQNDPSISPEVKQALLDDYNKNIRISDNTIEDKDLPLYAKKWLEENKVDIPTSVYVQGSSMFGGGQYVDGTKKGNTPEQIAFIKDFIANTPQGQDLVNRQKAYVEYLENSISDVETRVPELKKKYWQEQYDLSRSHPYPMGKTKGKAETDAARKDYIEKSNALTKRMSALNLAEKNAEEQKKLLAAVRDGDLNVLSQFGKQIGRDFWEMAGDIGTLGIRPMMQSLYESSDVKGLQKRMDSGEPLSEEDRLATSAMANNQAYQELMGDRRTIAQEVASGITQSAPFMVNFATTGGIGKVVTGGAKELLKQGIKRNAVNAIRSGVNANTVKIGSRLAGFGLNVADATGRASVMAAISPHTYRDMFDNMTGQVTYGYDEDGKPYYLGNVEQMDITNALLNAWGSNTIENVSEFSGFGMEKGQVALSRLLKQRVPEVAKALSFGSTRNQFFQGVNKAMEKAGFNGTVNEFLEEQVSTVLHSFFEDGQAQWSDLVDPRQQFITYLTVAAIGSGSAIMNTGGNQLMKHGAKKVYNNAFQDFGTEFYNSQNNDIAGQFADAIRNGTIEEKQSALADIVNSDLFNDKQKLAALNLYRAGLTYESYEGTKEAQVEEATQEIPAMIEENANPEMNAVVSAIVAGMDIPVQIIGGNIVQNEDGTINREQSDKEIYYVDADGNRQVTSIQYVENITENVPTQDAIAQVTEQVAAPIIAQQENEEVRPYEAGATVRFSPDGNTSLIGQIEGQDQSTGNYLLSVETPNGIQQMQIQPRQIINEDNLQGVENGSPVIYTNKNGEQIQDIVATSPDLYAQGLIGFENGDVIPVVNVIGLVQNNEVGNPAIEKNTDNMQADTQQNEGIISAEQSNVQANEPRVFEIEEGLSAVENADGTYALDKQFAKSELKKADNLVKRLNEDYSDNGLVFETVQLPRKDASNPFEKPLWGVVARMQQESPIQGQSEVPSQNRDNEHLWNVAENSDSPIDIASAYNEAMQYAGEERLEEWQKQLLGRKVNRASFEMFGDRNWINGAIARSWFNRKGEETNNGSIDLIAQELGTNVQSIVEFIVDHPSNRVKRGDDLTLLLNARFKEIAQGITGREVGGIESNSGKLFLSTLEYAANNTPTEIETEFMQSDVVSNIPNSVEFFLSDYMRLDEISDFNQFRDTVEEADRQGYFMFPLESKDKETILNYINNAEQQAKAIQGIGEDVSSPQVAENVEAKSEVENPQDVFLRKLSEVFPDGIKLYHRTTPENWQAIQKDGQINESEYASGVHAVLGDPNIDRVGGTNSVLLEISVPVSEYQNLYPEEATYLENFEEQDTGFDDYDMMFDTYIKEHPDLIGGDIMYNGSIPISIVSVYQPSLSERIAQAEAETDANPTEAQKEAGNYKKGKVTIQGLDISIEQPRGSVRSGTDQNGKKWSIEMQNTYGYIGKTKSKDGDHIDVFLGKNPENPVVFVVDQVNQDGSFDEHKVMLGFDSIEEAREAYLSNYEEGWQGLGNITQSDMDTFKKWAKSDTRKIKPFAEYKEIQDTTPTQKEMLSEVKKRKKDGKFEVELDRRMSKTPLVLMARRALQYNGKWRKASNSIEFDNEADAKAFRENERSLGDGTHYQSSTNIFQPVNPDKFNWVISQLEKTGLAKEIITDPTLFREKLDEVINDNATAKQVLSEMETIKQEAIANGTFMLAPNGKPTKLNENQWLQVRTKPFLDWFGDWVNNPEAASKVVDENGEPMVVYHATQSDFDSFSKRSMGKAIDQGTLGSGFYFTSSAENASIYAQNLNTNTGKRGGESIMPVFLSIENPYDAQLLFEVSGDKKKESQNFTEKKKRQGYDGAKFEHRYDFAWFVAYEPTQIKSAISNTGAFDRRNPDIRMQVLEDNANNLIVLHNLTEEKLESAMRIGGLPMPSIAITSPESGFTQYGEISLIGSKDVIDPANRKNKVFGADAYSPRYPNIVFVLKDSDQLDPIIDLLPKEMRSNAHYRLVDKIQDEGSRYLWESGELKTAFAMKKGADIVSHLQSKYSNEILNYVDSVKGYDFFDVRDNEDVKRKLTELWAKDNEVLLNAPNMNLTDENGILKESMLKTIFNESKQDLRNKGKIDEWKTKNNANDYINSNSLLTEYKQFVSDFYDNLDVEEKIYKGYTPTGKRKYVPHTLDNVMKEMKSKGLRGSEGWFYGVGSARSKVAPQFKSIRDIQKSRDKIVSAEKFKAVKDEMADEFTHVTKTLEPFYKYESNLAEYMVDEMARLVSRGESESFNQLSDEARKTLSDFIEKIKSVPTQYFEAKPQRAVEFDEFTGAAVPKEASDKIKQLLLDNGLEVIEYSSSEERASKINEFTRDKGIQFMRTNVGDVYGFVTPDGTVYLDSTRMNANTPVHEFGHLWNSFTKESNPDLYNRGAELVKESEYWQRVNDNPSYRDLSDDAKVDEALAMAIGDKGESIVNRNLKQRFVDWVEDIWNSIREAFGFKTDVAIEDMTLSDFTRKAVRNLLEGKRLVDVVQPTVFSAQDISEMEQIKQSSIDDGSFMKAPNGEPTNLTERQWLQVRTSNFKNWFGDWVNNPETASKVVDENGEPMVVYHGTDKKFSKIFNEFSHDFFMTGSGLNEGGKMFFFTQIKNAAKLYAFTSSRRKGLEYDNDGKGWDEKSYERIIPTFLNIRNPYTVYSLEDQWSTRLAKNSGNDGFIRINNSGEMAEIGVFESSQIKSATENKGDFNSDMNDIRFQSVNDVADATDSTMTEDMRNELDKRIKTLWFRIREAYEDKHLAVKKFLDVLRENGTEVAEHDDFYNKATHINGAIDAQLEQYNNKYQKPLNKAISELEKAGFEYRDIENYAILKHGLERNAWMKQDAINQYMANNPEATPEQIARFEQKLPDDFSGITDVEKEVGKHAEWFINDFEEKAGKDMIDNLWERVKDATSYSLNKQLEGQLIDKKTIEDLKNRYDYYIPLRGHDAEVAEDRWDYSPDMGTYFVAPLLKAKGRKTRSESPFAYIASMAQSAINSANRNILNQTILRLAKRDKTNLLGVDKAWYEKTGERDGKPVYEVRSPEYNEDPDTYRKNIEEFEERMAKLAEAGLAVQSGKKLDIGGLFIKRKQADQHEVHVFQNGTEYVVYINANPAVARAINGSNAKDLHKDLRFFAKVSRQMAANFTTRNPIFVASNFSRDYIFSSSILPVKENAKYALQFQRNMPRSADALQRYVRGKADLNKQQDRYLNEYILNGAKTGFSHILELQKVQKQIERDIKQGGKKGVLDYSVRPILEGLEAMNEIAENMSRLSVYITSREQGRSITQSVTDAKEVTVNFNRSGAGGLGAAWFRSLYLFVNAGIQALSNFAKVAQKNKAKTAMLISSYAMSGFAIMPMLSYLIGGDDGLDEYFKLSDWERQNNLCIYTGNGFIKIPLPHELRVFHKMGDEIYQSTFGKKDVTQSLLDTALGFSDLIPANPMGAVDGSWADIMPDATKPFFQLASNTNFTGSKITNEWADPNKPGYLRVRTNKKGEPFAPAFLVKLAETMDNATGGDSVEKGIISFNPDVVNHLMRGYFGGLYSMGMQGLDVTSKTYDWTKTGEFKLKVRETPLKTFYTSESDLQTSSSGLNTKYFKVVDDTQEAIRKVKGYKDQVADGKLSVTDFYSKIEKLNVPKANELYGRIKQIKKYESALKELDGQDQKELEKIISDLKKQVIEVNNSLSK